MMDHFSGWGFIGDSTGNSDTLNDIIVTINDTASCQSDIQILYQVPISNDFTYT